MTKETRTVMTIVGLTVMLGLMLKYIFPLVAPFFLGAIFACLIEPSIRYLEQKLGIHRKYAVILLITVLVGGMIFLLCITLVLLYREIQALLPQISRVAQQLTLVQKQFINHLGRFFPEIQTNFSDFGLLRESIDHLLRSLLNGGINLAPLFPRLLLWIGLGGVTAYFFSRDKESIARTYDRLVPLLWQSFLTPLKVEITQGMARFIRTELLLVLHTTVVTILVFKLLGSPGAIGYGLLAGFLDLIPVLGPGVVYIPAIGLGILFHQYQLAFGYLVGFFVLIATRQWIEIKLLGINLNLHPLLILIVVYVGMKLFGLIGAFFGPLLLVMLRGTYRVLRQES